MLIDSPAVKPRIAHEPPEERGLERDEVRLLMSLGTSVSHHLLLDLPNLLRPADVIVVNTSATVPAALPALHPRALDLRLHLSTHLPADLWSAELRRPRRGAGGEPLAGSEPYLEGRAGDQLRLEGGGSARLLAPYAGDRRKAVSRRLWVAELDLPTDVLAYLDANGMPITYGDRAWPLDRYQTVFATQPGSAEMPSAGRAFSGRVLAHLAARGVEIAPLLLHTGVSSPEAGEPPYEELYEVPAATARRINSARAAGGRVVAVGTTVVRALETVATDDGSVHPGSGWTRRVVSPGRPPVAIDALVTGWHERGASHLDLVESVIGASSMEAAYAAALSAGYLWHEFGDLHLAFP
jgi:S-adenosylmethionine:tRNA ribosyltransferase-isomerase